MEKRDFSLRMPEGEASKFEAKCAEYDVSRTSILRSFVRQFVLFGGVEFRIRPLKPETDVAGEA